MTDRIYWRCFHCGETFTKHQEEHARKHFGATENDTPICLIRSAGEYALVNALRNAQDELSKYHSDDSDLMRVIHSMGADYMVNLRRAEESGYAKGVRDATEEFSRKDK